MRSQAKKSRHFLPPPREEEVVFVQVLRVEVVLRMACVEVISAAEPETTEVKVGKLMSPLLVTS